MRTMDEMIERAVEKIIFDFTSEFGVRSMDGKDAYFATLGVYKALFGEEVYEKIMHIASTRVQSEL